MMRSLSSGVAGLRTHQTKMDVIGNNIANVNTYGFKASRTTFADVYYQNLSGASRGTFGVQGGRNPTQIGYGASVATIDVANTVSGAASTDFALDVYISGDGFLVSRDSSGKTMYTRLGKLDFDSAGNLVDGVGNLVQGFPMKKDENGNFVPDIRADGTIEQSDLVSINCDPEILHKLTGVDISPTGAIVGILQGDKIIKTATNVGDFVVRDSISINPDSHFVGDVKLTVGALPTANDIYQVFSTIGASFPLTKVTDVEFGDVGLPTSPPATYEMEVKGKTITLKVTDPIDPNNTNNYEGIVQEDGSVVLKSKTNSKIAMSFKVDAIPKSDAKSSPTTLTGMDKLKYQVTTRDEGENVRKLPTNGPRELTGSETELADLEGITIYIDKDKVGPFCASIGTATYADDVLYPIGNLALAKFPNPNGMKEAGSSYFEATANSGEPVFVKPSIDGTGGVKSGYLEMSNVDVSKEFTDMITTQRGFQANSRIITVSDTMLEELVNLKR